MLKGRGTRFLVAIFVPMLMLLSVFPAPARAANDPFTCSPGFYQVISGQLKLLNPTDGTYSNIGSAQPEYNAIGYNVLDNYLYGIDTITNIGDLLRIGSDGTLTDLGLPTGLPASGFPIGDMDKTGHLYVLGSTTRIWQIDVVAVTATAIDLTGDPVNGFDFVLIGTNLFALQGTTLTRIDLNTAVATATTVTGLASGNFGAGWTDSNDNLYFSRNNNGSIYQINNYLSGSPTATLKVTGAVTSNNDGASCVNTLSAFDPPQATADNYTTPFDTPLNQTSDALLSNDVGTALTVTSNTNPAHGTVTVNADGTFLYTPTAGFVGTDSFSYTVTDSFDRTATATVTISVAAADSAELAATGVNTRPYQLAGGLLVLASLLGIFRRRRIQIL